MKTTITMFAVAAFFTACNSNPKPVETAKIPQEDTAGLAEFKTQKELQEQDELIQTEGIYDGTTNSNGVAASPAPARRAVSTAPARRSTGSRSTSSSGNGTVNNSGSGTAQAPAPAKKEGWSKAAKGAAIGGASGAVIGAVVSKKKGKGAIIGGILGAGGGYVIGRGKDKKDGRVQ